MQTYQAIIIHPEVKGGRCSGTLTINPSAAVFQSEDLSYQIPVSLLNISAGGAGNRFIFLKDKTQDAVSIYTSDKSVLKDQHLAFNKDFLGEISGAKKVLRKTLTGTLSLLAIIGLFIASLYLLKDVMVESLAKQIPPSWEKAAGDKLFTALSLQYRFANNDSLRNEFLKVGAPLFKQVEKQGYKIDLYFVKDASINAFALPGGKVVVQTGLIENAKSWEEVMGVLGHELAHVSRRHHTRGIINNVGIYTLLSALIGDISAIAGTFASMGGDLASLSNSRTFENEADETGWDYLVQAKINPAGLTTFFETIKKEEKSQLDSIANKQVDLSFLSTHPAIDDRIKHLKEKQKEVKQSFKPLPNTFEDFKRRLLLVK